MALNSDVVAERCACSEGVETGFFTAIASDFTSVAVTCDRSEGVVTACVLRSIPWNHPWDRDGPRQAEWWKCEWGSEETGTQGQVSVRRATRTRWSLAIPSGRMRHNGPPEQTRGNGGQPALRVCSSGPQALEMSGLTVRPTRVNRASSDTGPQDRTTLWCARPTDPGLWPLFLPPPKAAPFAGSGTAYGRPDPRRSPSCASAARR